MLFIAAGWEIPLVVCFSCFLVGSIPFGFLVGKLNGFDIREKGSGNIGATNVLRSLGKKWGYTVFALDVLKGLTPVMCMHFFHERSLMEMGNIDQSLFLVIGGLLVVLGHNYCPWLGFKGGKGIASSAGVLLGLMPWTFLISSSSWVVVFFLSRYVSIASLAACLAVPVSTLLIYRDQLAFVFLSVLMGFLGVWRHRSNIKRLLGGTEQRFELKGRRKAE
ncbi:MAG: glycerol-3-phosphate 1-O-acyltransferase PlsY [Verrucomicrobiota bacterium]